MKTGKFSATKEVLFGVVTALSIAMAPIALSQNTGGTYLAETASIVGACGKLFEVDSNAAGLTAQERAAIIQKNLDYAIVNAKDRTPNSVRVLVVNRNPVVTLDGFHIATADGNSAARNGMSSMQLAQKWADSIKFCLADAAALDKYLAMLTGNYKVATAAVNTEEMVAYLPAGKFIPVKLVTPLDSEHSQVGDAVQAVISTDIPLQTSQSATTFEAYLPAGTRAIGHLVDASNAYTKNAYSVKFDEFRTPDGSVVPIAGHIFGGIGTWLNWQTNPSVVESAFKPNALVGVLATKGTICGGWRGYPVGAGLDIPFKKMSMARKTGVAIASGEPMMLQMGAPSVIALSGAPAAIAAGPLPPLALEPEAPILKTVSEARVFAPAPARKHAPAKRVWRRAASNNEIILK